MGEMMEFPATVEEFMDQYKIVDSDHVYTNGTELVPIFRMRQWFEHLDSVIKTNADRIRAMTDEELSEWYFDKFFPCVPYCSILDECPEHDDCKICLLEWLKQEATDEHP